MQAKESNLSKRVLYESHDGDNPCRCEDCGREGPELDCEDAIESESVHGEDTGDKRDTGCVEGAGEEDFEEVIKKIVERG